MSVQELGDGPYQRQIPSGVLAGQAFGGKVGRGRCGPGLDCLWLLRAGAAGRGIGRGGCCPGCACRCSKQGCGRKGWCTALRGAEGSGAEVICAWGFACGRLVEVAGPQMMARVWVGLRLRVVVVIPVPAQVGSGQGAWGRAA